MEIGCKRSIKRPVCISDIHPSARSLRPYGFRKEQSTHLSATEPAVPPKGNKSVRRYYWPEQCTACNGTKKQIRSRQSQPVPTPQRLHECSNLVRRSEGRRDSSPPFCRTPVGHVDKPAVGPLVGRGRYHVPDGQALGSRNNQVPTAKQHQAPALSQPSMQQVAWNRHSAGSLRPTLHSLIILSPWTCRAPVGRVVRPGPVFEGKGLQG